VLLAGLRARPGCNTLEARNVQQNVTIVSNISVRLPPDIERGLAEEARRTERNRSDLVREAVGEYLVRKERERFINEMKAAARALYSNPEAIAEAREIQDDFESVDTSLEQIEAEERAAGIDPDEKWWD
jgi:metal-responsive CopG/Arc/MetJ family transcriptional regulator